MNIDRRQSFEQNMEAFSEVQQSFKGGYTKRIIEMMTDPGESR